MNKKKLLIFHPALAPYRVDFFNSLNEVFDASFFFNLTNVNDQKFDQEALKKKCSFKNKYLTNGFDIFGRSFRFNIISIIRIEKPDIILCSEYGWVTLITFIYKICFRKEFKLYTLSDDSIDNSKSRNGVRSFLRNFISKNIDGIIFPSKEVCYWYKENISTKTKTLELPIIHNENIFREQLAYSLQITNYNIKKYNLIGKKIILFTGRLVEVKNLFFLLRSVAYLKSTNWILVIVGDGILLDDLIKESKKLKISEKVIFIGRREGLDLLSWYNIAQIFILPSIYEPYGAVVNEALLGGCYVLCSNLAGASSLINQTNGLVFNPYIENDLYLYLEKVLNETKVLTEYISRLRENKMPFSFSDKIDILFSNL